MSDMDFKHTTLPNGLDIVGEVNPSAKSMAAGFFVRTGARDEQAGIEGVSHFLEHMMFKGTARRTPFDVNREFDEMGAYYNAFTSEENTVYFGAVLPEFQTPLLDLLADILRPSLRQEDFDVEKNVIQEEIALYLDRPQYRVFEELMASFFASHPLSHSVLGTRQTIANLKRDDMQAYFDRRYSPGNITHARTGDSTRPAGRRLCHRAQPPAACWPTPRWLASTWAWCRWRRRTSSTSGTRPNCWPP
jgi:predicted Zn-dependent peptidase